MRTEESTKLILPLITIAILPLSTQSIALGQAAYAPTSDDPARLDQGIRQLADPVTGRPTFTGNQRQLTDPRTGRSTYNGYSIKLTDPVTGQSRFKGYGQDPLMQGRNSAPDFKWSSNVDAGGRSNYTGFGRDPLATPNGRSTFVGNNRRLTGADGRPTFKGNFRSLAAPSTRKQSIQNNQAYPEANDNSVKLNRQYVGGGYEDRVLSPNDTTGDATESYGEPPGFNSPESSSRSADPKNLDTDEVFEAPFDSPTNGNSAQSAEDKPRRFQPESAAKE